MTPLWKSWLEKKDLTDKEWEKQKKINEKKRKKQMGKDEKKRTEQHEQDKKDILEEQAETKEHTCPNCGHDDRDDDSTHDSDPYDDLGEDGDG